MGLFSRILGGESSVAPLVERVEPKFALQTMPAQMPRADVTSESFYDLTDPKVAEFLRGRGGISVAGEAITPTSAMNVSTAFRSVSIISGAVATLPMDIRRRVDDRTRVDASDHPLWSVLRKRPNVWMTPSDFKRLLQVMVLLRGNGYALILRAGGEVKQLVPLVGNMEVSQNSDLTLKYTYTQPLSGTTSIIPQSNILHLRGMSFDGIVGLSVISFARESLGIAIKTERHAAKMFKNSAALGGVIVHPKTLDDAVHERLKRSLDEYRDTESEAYKDLVLEEGMTYTKIGMSAVDAQFISQREFTQYEIAMFFGVPPHMLGLTSKTTSWGSGIEQQGIAFVTYTLQDWLTMWGESVERDCLGPDADPKLYCRINPAGLVRGDLAGRYAAYSTGRQWGWLSANDVREKEDMNPIPNGDVYLEPTNMQEAGKPPPAKTDNSQSGGQADPAKDPTAP